MTDCQELIDGCNWIYKENYNGSGRNGWLGTSKKNENTIFLPMIGNGIHNYHNNNNRRIYPYSSTYCNSEQSYSICCKPYAESESIVYNDMRQRYQSNPIFPVYE